MSDLKISGNVNPVVGKEESYTINSTPVSLFSGQIHSPASSPFSQQVDWSLYILENGKWNKTDKNDKKGEKVPYTFTQVSLKRKGIKIVAKVGNDEASLIIKPQRPIERKIIDVELCDALGNKATKPFAYGQTVMARVHCLNLDYCKVHVTLWEDDASGAGHSNINKRNKAITLSGEIVNGIAEVKFKLQPDFAKMADAVKAKGDKNEGKTHEYYVTAEIFNQKTESSNNINVNRDKAPTTPENKTPAETKLQSEKKVNVWPFIQPDAMDFVSSLAKIFVPDEKKAVEKKEENGACVCKDYNLIWGNKVSCDFRIKVVEISKRQNFDPNHLMAVMWVETNETFSTSLVKLMPNGKFRPDGNPKKENRGLNEKEINGLTENFSGPVGLIQFTPVAIDELNNYYGYSLTKRKLALMTQLMQLDYVEKYIEFWIKANKIKSKLTLADLYLLIFSPSKMNGSNDATTLYKEGTTYYNANQSIDTDKENGITKKELAHRAYESFDKGSKKENRASQFSCGTIVEKKKDEISSSGVLADMKIIADSHRTYLQETNKNRTADTEAGLVKMDCSEFVSRYLHKLGVTKNIIYMTTANMNNETSFRKVIENDNIDLIAGSKVSTFKPQRGDIFAWGRSKNGSWGGHTGVVYEYDDAKDTVTIMESIGSSGAVGERKQVKNGGHSGTNCTRTAIYDRLGGALFGHDGWFGYYRPTNYTKEL